jgi:hypothetical protein
MGEASKKRKVLSLQVGSQLHGTHKKQIVIKEHQSDLLACNTTSLIQLCDQGIIELI